jgi:hypothetical protein
MSPADIKEQRPATENRRIDIIEAASHLPTTSKLGGLPGAQYLRPEWTAS